MTKYQTCSQIISTREWLDVCFIWCHVNTAYLYTCSCFDAQKVSTIDELAKCFNASKVSLADKIILSNPGCFV